MQDPFQADIQKQKAMNFVAYWMTKIVKIAFDLVILLIKVLIEVIKGVLRTVGLVK